MNSTKRCPGRSGSPYPAAPRLFVNPGERIQIPCSHGQVVVGGTSDAADVAHRSGVDTASRGKRSPSPMRYVSVVVPVVRSLRRLATGWIRREPAPMRTSRQPCLPAPGQPCADISITFAATTSTMSWLFLHWRSRNERGGTPTDSTRRLRFERRVERVDDFIEMGAGLVAEFAVALACWARASEGFGGQAVQRAGIAGGRTNARTGDDGRQPARVFALQSAAGRRGVRDGCTVTPHGARVRLPYSSSRPSTGVPLATCCGRSAGARRRVATADDPWWPVCKPSRVASSERSSGGVKPRSSALSTRRLANSGLMLNPSAANRLSLISFSAARCLSAATGVSGARPLPA